MLLIDLTYNIRNNVLFFVSDAKIKAETPPLQKSPIEYFYAVIDEINKSILYLCMHKQKNWKIYTIMEHPLDQFLYCPECGSSHFEINNEKSKKCADCGFVYYFNPSAATVALILNEKNELLVCRRAKEPAKGTLDLPGGFIDMNETGEEGVAREVLEETGLKVKKLFTSFHFPIFMSIQVFLYTHLICFFSAP